MLTALNCPTFAPPKFLIALVIAGLVTTAAPGHQLHAQESLAADKSDRNKADRAKAESLKEMQSRVSRMIVKIPAGAESRRAELMPAPLIHYADQVRNLPESTLWVWQQEGLPILFCKVERLPNSQTGATSWQYCCVPATGEKADVEWERQFRWRARETAFQWVSLPDEADPRDQAPARLTQMRSIVRGFGGETEQTPIKSRQKMRLLTSPLHRFAAPEKNVLDGAVFGLTSNGTNPDALLVVEALGDPVSKARWRYGIVGMTGDAVDVVHKDKSVWSKPYTPGPGDHRSWMWYVSAQ
jgi:hypothetical protein